ncbi:hypothetical protein C2S52_022246 [Perilla frutescens var. hirtella]|nr:hypothetical protein C2S52_022246 [Perilla frutescens var. hirtella]
MGVVFVATPDDRSHARGNSTLDIVRQKLNDENLLRLCRTCLGHIVNTPSFELQNDLFFQMVLLLDRSSQKHLRFNIRDRSIEFSHFDFALVTGLRFRTSSAIAGSSAFHTLLFGGRPNIRFDEIEDLFIGECNCRGGAGEIFLKLALLYIVYGVIFYDRRLSRVINTRYIHLVDDIQLFDSFPWGLEAYDHLVESTHATQLIINAHSYCYALQVWVYEMIPAVGQVCASRIFDWPLKIPRVLRWVPLPSVSRLRINELFVSPELQVSVR